MDFSFVPGAPDRPGVNLWFDPWAVCGMQQGTHALRGQEQESIFLFFAYQIDGQGG